MGDGGDAFKFHPWKESQCPAGRQRTNSDTRGLHMLLICGSESCKTLISEAFINIWIEGKDQRVVGPQVGNSSDH